MTVTGDNLGADRLRREAKLCADMFFYARVDVGKSTDGAADGAGRDFVARGAQTCQVAIHLRVKTCKR